MWETHVPIYPILTIILFLSLWCLNAVVVVSHKCLTQCHWCHGGIGSLDLSWCNSWRCESHLKHILLRPIFTSVGNFKSDFLVSYIYIDNEHAKICRWNNFNHIMNKLNNIIPYEELENHIMEAMVRAIGSCVLNTPECKSGVSQFFNFFILVHTLMPYTYTFQF